MRQLVQSLVLLSVVEFLKERVLKVQACFFVGLGGFLGSVFRYYFGLIPFSGDYPVMTMMINFIGSVAIGAISEFLEGERALSPNAALFLKTGICGGFTTFSTFSLETLTLFQRGRFAAGISYSVCSVIFCLLGVYLGMGIAHIIKSRMVL